jgi:hypothetical protein
VSDRRDAAKKEEELKALVGQRYHNLMDSVDDALLMQQTVEKLQALLGQLSQARRRNVCGGCMCRRVVSGVPRVLPALCPRSL